MSFYQRLGSKQIPVKKDSKVKKQDYKITAGIIDGKCKLTLEGTGVSEKVNYKWAIKMDSDEIFGNSVGSGLILSPANTDKFNKAQKVLIKISGENFKEREFIVK